MPELFSGSCFHEPSNPQPRANVFWGLARRTAYALVGHEPEGAAEAVAREASCRVLQREPPTRSQPRSSEEGRLASVPAHLVAQTCQRLLAYHSARNAVFVQYHVIRLLRLLRKRHGRPEFIWDPAGYFDALAEGPLVVESATPEVWLRHFVPEARKVIEMATIAMATPEAAWRKLKGLLPNRSVCNALAADAV